MICLLHAIRHFVMKMRLIFRDTMAEKFVHFISPFLNLFIFIEAAGETKWEDVYFHCKYNTNVLKYAFLAEKMSILKVQLFLPSESE